MSKTGKDNAVAMGAPAPGFSLPTDSGETVRLSDFRGRPLVLYFYPKDDTAGCTKEALDFTAHIAAFEKANATVLGVSRDTLADHAKFKKKHKLSVLLGADVDGTVTQDYGVWVEKSMYGRKYMGIERATFLLDGKSVVRQIWRKVKVPGHVEDVLNAIKAL